MWFCPLVRDQELVGSNPFAPTTFLEDFVAFSRWLFARPFQNLSCFLYICTGSSLTKKFFRAQGRKFLCDR
jgi:hypothetical protein